MSSSHPGASGALDIVASMGLALAIALTVRVLAVQPFTVPSSSMEPALRMGDYLAVSKFDYGFSRHSLPLSLPLFSGRLLERTPRRGDVIVFKLPRDGRADYVKRVIGLPGDRIQLIGGQVWLNGRPLAQTALGPAADADNPARTVMRVRETLPDGRSYVILREDLHHEGEDTGVYVVPPGCYFFMGDNRDNSADSRWPADLAVGFVPAENLEGRVRTVMWSWNAGASIFKPWTWLDLRLDRFFRLLG